MSTSYLTALLFLLCSVVVSAQELSTSHRKDSSSVAGEEHRYVMKKYFFVMLKRGPNRTQDSATSAKIQQGHMDNMQRLADAGSLVVAGPFLDDGDWRGLFVFDAATREEVEELLKTDIAISSGRLSYEIHPWMTAQGTCFK